MPRLRPAPGALARILAAVPPASGAVVMGIVSVALALDGHETLSRILLVIDVAAWLALAVLLGGRAARASDGSAALGAARPEHRAHPGDRPAHQRAAHRDLPRRAPRLRTIGAGTLKSISGTDEERPVDPDADDDVATRNTKPARAVRPRDMVALERWLNEGGHLATDAVRARETGAADEAGEDRRNAG